jgi:galactose-1-phosphate uridylyltransferase
MSMIEFRSQPLFARSLRAGDDGPSEVTEALSEVRWDPLTGRTMRITAPRPAVLPVPREGGGEPELPEKALAADRCPFCDDLARVTPGLVSELGGERRLVRGEATLFPNLYPYGCWSAVIALTRAHHVPLARFPRATLEDGLWVARDYVRRVRRADPAARHVNVTWNLLPSSGGTLVHPHLQVNVDPIPVNSLRETQEGAAAFRARHGADFFETLVAEERRLGLRFLADLGETAWLLPFAPQAHVEVWGVVPGRTRLTELSDATLSALAEGLHRVMQAYARAGRNALNMAIECDEGPAAAAVRDPAVRLRVVARSSWRAWYRSDQTHFDVVLEECATVIAPEAAAALLRPSFDAPAGVDPTRISA